MKAADIRVGDRMPDSEGTHRRVEARRLDGEVYLRLASGERVSFDPQAEVSDVKTDMNPWRMGIHELRKKGSLG